MTGAASSYEGDAGRALTARYEAVYPDELHKGVTPHFPAAPAAVLDIGAGSGRDAAWLAEQGYTVLAVEPSETMRMEGARLHPDARIGSRGWVIGSRVWMACFASGPPLI